MAVDFMRHEAHRVELQDAIDRGVLAAAALDQRRTAEETIRGYIRTTDMVPDDYLLAVTDVSDTYQRTVTAAAQLELRTYFLKMVGLPSLTVSAHGIAQEVKQDVEVSLVLDISTSMSGCALGTVPCDIDDMIWTGLSAKSRLEQMKEDAQQFVDIMVNRRSNGYLTMSIVPFAGQVNPGSTAFDYLRSSQVQPYSYCIEFTSGDFLNSSLPPYRSREQMQYFSYSYYYLTPGLDPTIEYGWCPGGNLEEIIYHSDDAAALKSHIAGLKTHEGTGSQYGMKWGAMLVDPSSRPLTSALVTANKVDAAYAGRPGDVNTQQRLKFVVFMSDGNTTNQVRVNSGAYDSSWKRDWWATNVPDTSTYYTQGDMNPNYIDVTAARTQFIDACNAAKAAGITIFTIGFDIEAASDAYTDLSTCATSISHFYDVDGYDLNTAFTAIAATIQKLKLTF